ncbi:hypothetical protein BU17DRAFT_85455 [Hysterangium stoloniferum]|nr:hypothetical protein BU17DRAFT_85455 [Hysterangium stoloniferum]
MAYQFRTVSPSDFYHISLLSPSPPLPSSHVMPLTPTHPSSKCARYLSEASNMQVPHPHSPMNVDTPICPLPPNSSSMVNTPTGHSGQVISMPFPGHFSQSHYLHECLKDASSPTKKRTQQHKPREEFMTNDLKALLSAVLNVNPWMCTCGESKDKWQEVSVLVKLANVYSLLKAVEPRGASTWNSLTRDAGLVGAESES